MIERENVVCVSFFAQVSSATDRVLMLDYDGTLAPFSTVREQAHPYAHVRDLLSRIRTGCNTRLVIVSGRPAHTVPPLLGLTPELETWGSHGLERLHPDGRYEIGKMSTEVSIALAQAEEQLRALQLGHLIERKSSAIAVHWRGLSFADLFNIRPRVLELLAPVAANAGLLLSHFNGGVELRVRSARKGDAVRTILGEVESTVPVAYLGDDFTDEDAFNALNGRGLTALVRDTYRYTAAQVWLRPPEQLIGFFRNWIRASEDAD